MFECLLQLLHEPGLTVSVGRHRREPNRADVGEDILLQKGGDLLKGIKHPPLDIDR